jgi:ADP-heptose:LPS heptosyltransferase
LNKKASINFCQYAAARNPLRAGIFLLAGRLMDRLRFYHMPAPENILLVRLKSIGDIIFTLPAVHAVRENFPDAKLHFLVSKEHAQLLQGFADVDEIIPLDRNLFRTKNFTAWCADGIKFLRELRRKKFSRVIDFQGYAETEMLSWWSGAPERWGNVYQWGRGWAYTRCSARDWQTHPAEWNLKLLRDCGLDVGTARNEYVLPLEKLNEAKEFFAANHLDAAKPTLFLQPFTSNPQKNWPLENYLALARHFRSNGAQIIFGGGPDERQKLEPAHAADFVVAAGTPLLVSAGLMKLSTAIVGADTGLLHLANAMGKRVVMLMQSSEAGKPHPFQHPDWALTPPAGKIVADISVKDVINSAEKNLRPSC